MSLPTCTSGVINMIVPILAVPVKRMKSGRKYLLRHHTGATLLLLALLEEASAGLC